MSDEVELKYKTPVTQAVEIINILDGCWLTDFNGDTSHKPILDKLFETENIDAVAMKQSLLSEAHLLNPDFYDKKIRYLGFLLVISAYCIQAVGEYLDNNEVPTNLAWAYVVEAERMLSSLETFRYFQLKIKEFESGAHTDSSWAKVLVESVIKAHKSALGKARADKDSRTKALKDIETIDYPANKHLFHLRGRRDKFAIDMLDKYKNEGLVSKETILRLVDRLNKQNGITQKKPK